MPHLTFIYDGECGFCQRWVARVRRHDTRQLIEYLPWQSPETFQRFPQLPREEVPSAGFVILPDGKWFAGADAAPHILRALPGWRWLAAVFSIPGVPPIARWVYKRIARNRHRLSCSIR